MPTPTVIGSDRELARHLHICSGCTPDYHDAWLAQAAAEIAAAREAWAEDAARALAVGALVDLIEDIHPCTSPDHLCTHNDDEHTTLRAALERVKG